MPLDLTIAVTVPALPNTGIWFANAQAWTNYWAGVTGTATLIPVTTTSYTTRVFTTYDPAVIQIDGVEYVLCTKTMFDELKAQLTDLDNHFKTLRTELKDGGLISNAA
jgi:hypothetical protein